MKRLADHVNVGLTDDEAIRLTGEVGRFDRDVKPSLDADTALAQAPDREGNHFRTQSASGAERSNDRVWVGWRVEGQLDPAGRPAVALWWHLVNDEVRVVPDGVGFSPGLLTLCDLVIPTDRQLMRFTGPRAPGTSCGFCEAVYSGRPTL